MTDPDSGSPLPALTLAEQNFVDHYLRAIEVLGRMNPAQNDNSPVAKAINAAQSLESAARGIRAALEQMNQRGEDILFSQALARALLFLDGERRVGRLGLRRAPGGRS